MVRKDVFITEEQDKAIGSLEGTFSEHVRRALDEYIDKVLPVKSPSHDKNKPRS